MVSHRSVVSRRGSCRRSLPCAGRPAYLGDDFDALATAFNHMASRLESIESPPKTGPISDDVAALAQAEEGRASIAPTAVTVSPPIYVRTTSSSG